MKSLTGIQHTFVEVMLQKDNLKSVFWKPEFGCPNQYTSLQKGLHVTDMGKKNTNPDV